MPAVTRDPVAAVLADHSAGNTNQAMLRCPRFSSSITVPMEGFTGLDYPARFPEAFEALARNGSVVHKEDVAYGLENAPKALLRLFSGENFG